MESKTYVFGENGNNGMMSLLAPLMQKSGLDPNLLLAMNRNNGGFGGEGDRFLWVIFLFFLMGWGGNGWGFGRNNGGGIANEINNDYGRSLLMDAIDLYRIVPRRERAADIERFVRCFGISANDINKPKQVCNNPL